MTVTSYNADRINYLNVGLILLSTAVAYWIPFELFLFAYAVLGPLHYLTEISWLHQRNYFTKGKYDWLWLTALALFSALAVFGFKKFMTISMMAPFIALISGMAFYFLKDWYLKLVVVLIAFIAASMMNDNIFYFVLFLVFLPTILHVFFFTGTFMLHGAIKSKSKSGYLAILVFALCAASFFFIDASLGTYAVTDYIRKAYHGFLMVNNTMLNLTQLDQVKNLNETAVNAIFTSAQGITIMRFIAFAYTYHYLNWFSKTSIIKWHQVNRSYLILTLLIWVASVGIYLHDYTLGLKVLFFLSFLHVFLEFPLNIKTFVDLGQEFKLKLRPTTK